MKMISSKTSKVANSIKIMVNLRQVSLTQILLTVYNVYSTALLFGPLLTLFTYHNI